MNACGETGAAGDSEGGGAGVSNSARMSEKKVLCGTGRVMRLDVLREVSLSQASRWRLLPERRELPLEAGRDDGGYRSKRSRRISTMSWRVATSPGFLSE